jgi:hypothetical protein
LMIYGCFFAHFWINLSQMFTDRTSKLRNKSGSMR